MVDDIASHLPLAQQHQALWLQGTGGKSFCAGGDVKVLFQQGSSVEDRLTFFRNEFTLDYNMSQLKAVQISCWDGIVMGGGVGLSVFSPIIIATEKTVFAMPETKLGFFTDVGASYVLSRLRNNIGYYLGLTGLSLKGEEVYIAGLAHFYIPSEKIEQAYLEIRHIFAQKV
jgi:3-hydroxyisobutyryl-CoA hydrolase